MDPNYETTPNRYSYIGHIFEDLMEEVTDYILEIEHQFTEEYRNLSRLELLKDFHECLGFEIERVEKALKE